MPIIGNMSITFEKARIPARSSPTYHLVDGSLLSLNGLLSTALMLVGTNISEMELIN